jgi:Spy/CpxP family protein refolding chaperone
MGLTDEQIKQLKEIQLDLDRTRIQTEADIKVAEREARALIDDESSNLSAIEAKLQESANKQVSLRVASVKARRDAMAVLTPEQSKRVKMFHQRMKEQMRSGKMGHPKGDGKSKDRGKEEDDD